MPPHSLRSDYKDGGQSVPFLCAVPRGSFLTCSAFQRIIGFEFHGHNHTVEAAQICGGNHTPAQMEREGLIPLYAQSPVLVLCCWGSGVKPHNRPLDTTECYNYCLNIVLNIQGAVMPSGELSQGLA